MTRRKRNISSGGSLSRGLSSLRQTKAFGLTLPLDQKLLEGFFLLIFFGFGLYLSILYYGHQAVPNSDFPAFLQAGEEILSFHPPSSYKRLPGLGILQSLSSHIVPGQHPALTAGLLLNCIFYALAGPLLYLMAKPLIGRNGAWFALLAMINPMTLHWMRHPIADIPLAFFIMLTFVVLFRKSRWAYLCAAAASVIRYEGAVLIPIVLVCDLLGTKNWKSRFWAMLRAALAAIPITLWLGGMVLSRTKGAAVSSLPYIRNYGSGRPMVPGKFFQYVWQNTAGNLFIIPSEKPIQSLILASQIIFVLLLLSAAFFALYKKDSRAIALLSFFVICFILHATRDYTLPRYTVPLLWPGLLAAWYGLYSLWKWLGEKLGPPGWIVNICLLLIGLLSLIWLINFLGFLPRIAQLSRRSASVPWVSISIVVLILAGQIILWKRRNIFAWIVLLTVMPAMIAANQFMLVREVGSGSMDKEFKMLADWYVKDAKGEKLAVNLGHVVVLFIPAQRNNLVGLSSIRGTNPQEFIEDCLKKNISYIAWDSRIGRSPTDKYYKQWRMERLDFLRMPGNYGPLMFFKKIQNPDYPNRYINIYKVVRPTSLRRTTPQAAESR